MKYSNDTLAIVKTIHEATFMILAVISGGFEMHILSFIFWVLLFLTIISPQKIIEEFRSQSLDK